MEIRLPGNTPAAAMPIYESSPVDAGDHEIGLPVTRSGLPFAAATHA